MAPQRRAPATRRHAGPHRPTRPDTPSTLVAKQPTRSSRNARGHGTPASGPGNSETCRPAPPYPARHILDARRETIHSQPCVHPRRLHPRVEPPATRKPPCPQYPAPGSTHSRRSSRNNPLAALRPPEAIAPKRRPSGSSYTCRPTTSQPPRPLDSCREVTHSRFRHHSSLCPVWCTTRQCARPRLSAPSAAPPTPATGRSTKPPSDTRPPPSHGLRSPPIPLELPSRRSAV
jgi:hypothetical protein